jgi:hypothetical protein
MKYLNTNAIVLAISLVALSIGAEPLRADHPLIGTWKITLPNSSCYETYVVRRDGTSFVTSAEQIAESEFSLSDKPSDKDFYKWVDKITKDNGKKDCSGEIMQLGHTATNYIRLHPNGNMFLMCEKEDMDTCIGPFLRQKESNV